MGNPISVVLLLVVMAAIIVGVDILFFASAAHTWDRLIVNIGIVIIFIAIYLRFLS